MTACVEATEATAEEIGRSLVQQLGDKEILVDLGPRATLPARDTWLDWTGSGILLLAQDGYEGVGLWCFRDDMPDWKGQPFNLFGQATEVGGGIFSFGVFKHGTPAADETNSAENAAHLAAWAFASLAIIGSPRAQTRPVAPHRGVRRLIDRAFSDEIVATTVFLPSPQTAAGSGGGVSTPKAYHFCRAHNRVRRGRVEHVRAHWRGDPAYGYRVPSYQVAATLSAPNSRQRCASPRSTASAQRTSFAS